MNHIFDLTSANADFVTDFLVIGGDLAEDKRTAIEQAVELADFALVTHVLDCRLEEEEYLWERFEQVDYRWDGIDDRPGAATAEWFDRISDWASAAIEAGGTVLAHCHMGINRGPSAGFAILLRQGWDPIHALDAIGGSRAIAHIAFAEEPLEWHLSRVSAPEHERVGQRRRLAEWRDENPMDVVRVIRRQRGLGQDDVA